MALKKPTGDMYDFIDGIWNPVTGRCSHACSYCYVTRIMNRVKRFQPEPRLVPTEMKKTLGIGQTIFVCSGCDLFADNVSDEIILAVVGRALLFWDNTFIFQTKNPQRLIPSLFGISAGLHKICSTIETNRFIPAIMRNAPAPAIRAMAMQEIADKGIETMVTVEPVMDFDIEEMLRLIRVTKATQVNIGADSGNNNLPEPSKEKLHALISELSKDRKVVQKKNLRRLMA